MTKADRLVAALDGFLGVSPDVEAAAVVSADGLPMASALPPDVEEDRLAAMSAALLTLGERAADGMGKGDLAQVFVEAGEGYIALMAAGPNAVLVAITSGTAKVGLVLFEMRRAAARIIEIMEAEPIPNDPLHQPTVAADANGFLSSPVEHPAPPAPAPVPEATSPSESTFSTWH